MYRKVTNCSHTGCAQFQNEANSAFIELQLLPISFDKSIDNYSQWEVELQGIVAAYLGISRNSVQVVQVLPYTRAELIICNGNIASFLNAIEAGDESFDNTMLEGSSVKNVLWGYPCANEYPFVFSQTLDTDGTTNGDSTDSSLNDDQFIRSSLFSPASPVSPLGDSSNGTKLEIIGFMVLSFVVLII